MANGVYGHGRVKRVHRGLGVGTIQPNNGGDEVIFTGGSVRGGARGFEELAEGDRVRYLPYPGMIAGSGFAEDVSPDTDR